MALTGRIVVVLVAGVAAVLVIYTFVLITAVPGTVEGPVPPSFTVNGKTFVFNYTATTQSEREAGLMNRRVTASTTMLFAFPSFSKWAFWMKDTNTSLDIIWVNATGSTGRVVYLVQGTQPESTIDLIPNAPANYVIETRAGFAASNGITVGTAIQFS
jgi:uncharacterized membrane protein (UPF0127 family)